MLQQLSVRWMLVALAALLACTGVFPASAQAVYPDVVPLPDGWLPEGIAIGRGHTFYSGSRASGSIYRGDLRTGEGEVFIEVTGRVAVGLKYHPRCDFLIVAGGPTGQGYVYDATSGDEVQVFQFTTASSFINDVAVVNDTAYFTNSQAGEIYVVDLSDCDGLEGDFEVLPLSGDWEQVAGFNANGIVAHPSGKYLIVVNSTLGNVYRVDPDTGEAVLIDLGAEGLLTAGDGLLLRGQTLYVVRNQLNQIAVVKLDPDWTTGEIVDTITDAEVGGAFDIPTTVGIFGNALYAINARFTTPPTPTTPYNVVRVEL
jgi:sugar lactone lactonase YvrE